MAGQSETATREALQSLQEKDIIVPDVGVRLAGEREYSFKHVLIRDVAYGMLPKAVRCAQALRHRPLPRGPRRRAHRRGRRAAGRALRARRDPRRARAAWRASTPSRSIARRSTTWRPRATPPPRSTPTPRRSSTTRRRRRSTARTTPARSRAWSRSRATSRSAWVASAPRSSCGRRRSSSTASRRTSRASPTCTARSAPACGTGRAQAGDRALPEGHQPAQGRPAVPRARAPVRGGGLALHARGRQHARDLRLREGAAARREAAGDARREPRARHLRPRVRAHRRHRRRRARTSSARSSWRATPTTARRSARCSRSATTSRSRRPTTTAPGQAYGEALALAQQIGDLPAQVELQSSIAQVAAYRAAWDEVRGGRRGERRPGRARGPGRQALLPVRAARRARLARGPLGGRRAVVPPRARAGRAGRLVRGRRSRRSTGWRARCATAATTRPRSPSSTARSTCASAPA